jgi:hypothetical protein
MRGVLAHRFPTAEAPNLAAQGQSVSRTTVAEVPLTGLSFPLARPVVVTGAGSFAELPPELAGCVPADCSPDALATAIEAAATTEESDRRRQELLTARSPEAFADRILEILRLPLAGVS